MTGKNDDQEIEKLVERFLICRECDQHEKDSHFSLINPGFQPRNALQKCSKRLHHLSDNQKKLMTRDPVDLNAFCKIPELQQQDKTGALTSPTKKPLKPTQMKFIEKGTNQVYPETLRMSDVQVKFDFRQ